MKKLSVPKKWSVPGSTRKFDKIRVNKGPVEITSQKDGLKLYHKTKLPALLFLRQEMKKKTTYIPESLAKIALFLLRTFTSQKFYGPLEFFLTVLTRDMVAPEAGEHTLREFYANIKEKSREA